MTQARDKKLNRVIRVLISVCTVILIISFFGILQLVNDIQGTARVVNYAGLVRGTTQRIVKLEIAQEPQDKLIERVDSYIEGLMHGSKDLNLVRINDKPYQDKMLELDEYFHTLDGEIALVRAEGYKNTRIIAKSEEFFTICDEATSLAEDYAQAKTTKLSLLEKVVIADIVCLILLVAFELLRALRFSALNRTLQKKVYLDKATGLPNKNKCVELLSSPEPADKDGAVAVCALDLNDLRTINNTHGHAEGDEYIRSFAHQLAKLASDDVFVGRNGGDEFIAIIGNASKSKVNDFLECLRDNVGEHTAKCPSMPISYAVGCAFSAENEGCTIGELYRLADKNMYVDKNRAKMREAAERHQHDLDLLRQIEARGLQFSDCLYCNAQLDSYRSLRTSSANFLAEKGSYSGAVEQMIGEFEVSIQHDALRELLDLDSVISKLVSAQDTIEIPYIRRSHHGRLTIVPLDYMSDGQLHHFALCFEPFYLNAGDEKQQLSRYYDQFKDSILENGDYVEALLESAQAVYSVDLTNDVLDKTVSKDVPKRRALNVATPCSYNQYALNRSRYVTEETLESFRLIDTCDKLLKRFTSGASQATVEYQEIGTDGTLIWIQKTVLMSRGISYNPKTGKETPAVRGIILFKDNSAFHEQDAQERRRLEKALKRIDMESKAKTDFMNRMSHDFRTPINGIMGMLDIIEMSGEEPVKTHECLGKIRLSADHLLDLVNDVLDMSKLQAGETKIARERFDLVELVDDVESLLEGQLHGSDVMLQFHAGSITHPKLVGSPLHIKQIMLNLGSNAIKYNKPGGKIDTYARELSCDGNTTVFEFAISDTGIGMSEEFVENELFKPFTQEQFGARTQYKGTGLGMSIVKELIDLMGGRIAVESKVGEGTTITFSLPLEVDKDEADTPASSSESHADSIAGKHVLLVEDNELNMEIAEYFLASAGALVDKAWNGKEAVEVFKASSEGYYCAVLMDLMMPIMDGLEATRRIRDLERADAMQVPILAMTANAFSIDRERTRAAGMNDHLVKPLSMEQLLEALGRYCG